MVSEWLSVTPQILFALAVCVVPGFAIAVGLRFRWWDAASLSVPLSIGALALANIASIMLDVRWGLPVVVVTTAVVAVACWGGRFALAKACAGHRKALPVAVTSASGEVDGVRWTARRQHLVAAAATLAAVGVGAFAVARGIGTPDALNRTWDGVFHVNAIDAISQAHTASPSFVAHLGGAGGTDSSYPPTFAAFAALLVMYVGVNPYVAANVAAVAIAALWPIAVSIAVRRLARPTAFGYVVAMIGAVTVGLYPSLLLEWGTVWPNAMSVLALPGALVLATRLVGVDRRRGGEDPHGRLAWMPALIAAAVIAVGMVLVQPNVLFALMYLGLPLVGWAAWRRWHPAGARPRTKVLLGLVGVGVLLAALYWLIQLSHLNPSIRSIARFYWEPQEDVWGALTQVFQLTSSKSHPNIAFACLVVVGIVVALRYARGRYLVLSYAIVVVLCVCAAAIQNDATMLLTGYWYNDPLRLYAMLPAIALPLAALGADAFRDLLRAGVERWGSRLLGAAPRWTPTAATIAAIGVCAGIVALQSGIGTARISDSVVRGYAYSPGGLVSPGQALMFKRLESEDKVPAGMSIAGNPYTGEVLAGVLSGHPVVYPTFHNPGDPVRAFVGLKFRSYQADPVVCEAVKSLNIGVVVTGRIYGPRVNHWHDLFVGFDDMASIPGLTKIDSGGGATAYRVGECETFSYPLGFEASLTRNVMFAQLSQHLPEGMTIAGNPYQGEIVAAALSGRSPVYPAPAKPRGADQILVAKKFAKFQKKPAVCAAVKRLKIGVVIGSTTPAVSPRAARSYPGFDNLAAGPGLTPIATEGTTTAYAVGNCATSKKRSHTKRH